jgi:hypothetical protein
MLSMRKTILLLVAAIFVVVASNAVTALRGQNQEQPASLKAEKPHKRQIRVEDYPLVDYAAPEPADLQERSKRRAKSSRHGVSDKSIKDLKNFVFNETSQPLEITQPPDHAPAEPALPASQSDAILIGDITNAQAYLSHDKTGVYSEFTTQISDIPKNAASLSLAPGDSVAVERSGGRVRLPSGKIVLRGFSHKTMPLVGKRYLLFLKYNEQGQDFSIITGYELRSGKIFPLDGVPQDDYKMPQFAVYVGVDEAPFLSEVRAAIARSQSSSPHEQEGERGTRIAFNSPSASLFY